MRQKQLDRRHIASIADWSVWSDWHAGEIRAAGIGADQDGEHVSVRNAADQSDRMFFSRADRAASAEPRDCASGMANGDRGGIFRWIHHVFEFRMGDGEDARSWRMALGDDVCGGKRGVWVAAFRRRDPFGQQVLGARDDAPEI